MSKKLFINYLASITLTILLFSCKNRCSDAEIKRLMGDMYRNKITFPSEVELLNKGLSRQNNNLDTNITVAKTGYTVIHFFTADCDKCIDELIHIQSFLKKQKENNKIKYIFIASAPTKVYAEDAIKKIHFNYPVFYEKNYFSFKKLNGLSLLDKLYNTMLLNGNQEVLLFGSLFNNQVAEKLFFKTIDCGI